jgi:short-chain fatty acids transporter
VYSAFLGLFIPPAGGKWLIEAPYMLEAAKSLEVHRGEWSRPTASSGSRHVTSIVGYSMLQFVAHVPLVLFLVWILNYTLTYTPPALP